MKEIRDIARHLECFKRDIRLEMRELKESVNFCVGAIDNLNGLSSDIVDLRQELKELNSDLKAENERLSKRVEELEQYQRQHNLKIKCALAGSDPTEIVQRIGEKVGEIIRKRISMSVYFVSTPKVGVSNIVVRCIRRNKRNGVLKKARKAKIECHALGLPGSGRVYVNEHLTQRNKKLLTKALQKSARRDGSSFGRQEEKFSRVKTKAQEWLASALKMTSAKLHRSNTSLEASAEISVWTAQLPSGVILL